MKNFVFLSPNFPANYWLFCRELKKNGLRVLGIGDCPYDELTDGLRAALDEYYKVPTLEDYDAVYRAVAFFIHKYGRIDWLETNNEYWLERDARLRTDFNIPTGFHSDDMHSVRHKSAMKAFYKKAGVPTARWRLVETPEDARAFVADVGYPVICKPDDGVGACSVFRLHSDEELSAFLGEQLGQGIRFIMEEFVQGYVCSYDAVVDSAGTPIFETGNVTPASIVDMVNEGRDCTFYIRAVLPDDLRDAGRRTVRAFGVKSRFIHFEFFRLTQDMPSIGPKGTIAGLEVNMRPSGGCSPDMMNFANHTDVYKIWADMIAFDHSTLPPTDSRQFCAYFGRRDFKNYVLSDDEVRSKYANQLQMVDRVPDVLSDDMGNRMFIANFDTEDEVFAYYRELIATK